MAREIWTLQCRLKKMGKRSFRVLTHNRFRAAYDFLLLRAQAGEELEESVQYWTEQQLAEPMLLNKRDKPRANRSRSRRRSRNKKRQD